MRRQTAPEPPTSSARGCPRCGAPRGPSALRCTICGQSFASAAEVSELWGPVAEAAAGSDEPAMIDLYASEADGGIFRAGAEDTISSSDAGRVDLASDRRPPAGPVSDPWASSAGTLGAQPGKPDSGGFAPPGSTGAPAAHRGSRLRRVLLTILVLLVVGGAAAWYGARPYLSRQIIDNVGGAIDDQLDGVATPPVDGSGRITIVERDITRALRSNAAAYEPILSPRVALSRNGIRITFTLYGVEHTLTSTIAVEAGRVVLVDPILVGRARQLIDVDAVVASTEESLADLFARTNLRPVSLKTSDDTLTITTEPTTR